jgi:hypothetical protein
MQNSLSSETFISNFFQYKRLKAEIKFPRQFMMYNPNKIFSRSIK